MTRSRHPHAAAAHAEPPAPGTHDTLAGQFDLPTDKPPGKDGYQTQHPDWPPERAALFAPGANPPGTNPPVPASYDTSTKPPPGSIPGVIFGNEGVSGPLKQPVTNAKGAYRIPHRPPRALQTPGAANQA
jgi:hypothetical protein